MTPRVFIGADIFDGRSLHHGLSLVVADGRVADLTATPPAGEVVRLPGGVLAPGMIDLQVNGGGGVMVDGSATPASLATLCDVHARLGATGILPTLITDTPAATAAVLAAGIASARAGTPGFLGLYLEGPHLDPVRKGAHDPDLIRPMGPDDLARICDAAHHLPALMVTLAPAAVTPDQIVTLTGAGVMVSLGHAACTFQQAEAAHSAGARVVTHLFNAMSGLGHREPGLVGAALALPFDAGLIADGLHVHPQTMRLALAAKQGGRVFLVSDAMAVAGTDLSGFSLGGRQILRRAAEGRAGRLTLADGTLAGADLTLPQAVAVMVRDVGLTPAQALAMATSGPAAVIRRGGDLGQLAPGRRADLIHLSDEMELQQVWRAGVALT
jgi:N-acetylglucosamine-6-phosphate deacetylase